MSLSSQNHFFHFKLNKHFNLNLICYQNPDIFITEKNFLEIGIVIFVFQKRTKVLLSNSELV